MKLSDHFYFPRNERRALLVIILFAAAVAAWVYGTDNGFLSSESQYTDTLTTAKGNVHRHTAATSGNTYYYAEERAAERFPFDPNTADSTQLLRLGLSPWQVRSIYKYRAHGGVFRKAEDFSRVYGLTAKQYRELRPYIRISADYQPAADVYKTPADDHTYSRDTLLYPVKLKPGQHVTLNRADTSELKKVPGIGSVWARAIVSYGHRLGGYHSVGQLKDMEGFPEESLPYFVTDNTLIVKINVNKASVSRLRQHPYINFYQARAIRDYVRMHGPIKSLTVLSQMPEFPPAALAHIEPYVEY